MNRILLNVKKPTEDTSFYITKALDPIRFDKVSSNLFWVTVDDLDMAIETIKSVMTDLYIDIGCYIEEASLNDALYKFIYDFLINKGNGIYKLSDIIEFNVLENNIEFKKEIKTYFINKLSQEVIDAALKFIEVGNSIKASKELFIHRNTLNYRIDTVKKVTSLDLKYFKDQLAFYGLFH